MKPRNPLRGWTRRVSSSSSPLSIKVAASASLVVASGQMWFVGLAAAMLPFGLFFGFVLLLFTLMEPSPLETLREIASSPFTIGLTLATTLTVGSMVAHSMAGLRLITSSVTPSTRRLALGAHALTLSLVVLPILLQHTFPPAFEVGWVLIWLPASLGYVGLAASIVGLVALSMPSARRSLEGES